MILLDRIFAVGSQGISVRKRGKPNPLTGDNFQCFQIVVAINTFFDSLINSNQLTEVVI